MKNSEESAFPKIVGKPSGTGLTTDIYSQEGVTKREYFSGLAMQGLLANGMTSNEGVQPPYSIGTEKLIKLAIENADELLKQLAIKS